MFPRTVSIEPILSRCRQPSRYNTIRNIPARTASSEAGTKPSPQVKAETSAKPSPSKSGADYPEVRTSKIDVDAKPVYEPAGKPITAVNIDEGRSWPLLVRSRLG